MAANGGLTTWTDVETGTRYIQIEGKIYEQVGPGCTGRRPADSGRGGDPGWEEAGGKKSKRWQRAHKLQEKQPHFTKGGGKGGGKPSIGQKQPPGATAAEGKSAGKGTYKGSSRPQGGAYNPSTFRPWVPCCNPSCQGHQGKRSFKYVDTLGTGEHGHHCMGCGTSWAESIKSQLAWGTVVGLAPASGNHSLVSTAGSSSPFSAAADNNLKDDNSSAPFSKAPAAFEQLPVEAREEWPKDF